MRNRLLCAAVLAALMLTATTSNANVITFSGALSSPVNDPSGLLSGLLGFTPVGGETITGSLTFSPSAVPLTSAAGPNFGVFSMDRADVDLEAQINGMPLVVSGGTSGVFNLNATPGGFTADAWTIGESLGPLNISLFLVDSSGTFTDDASILKFPTDITAFDSATFYFNTDVPIAILASAPVTLSVPEPETLSLFAVGLIGLGLRRSARALQRGA
jgi:PEP-CTERM motif-containing protein